MMCVQRMKIIHRDLKSANCLVDKHWSVKICDFGLSTIVMDSAVCNPTAVGTPEWTAPELLRNELVTDKCDVFSFGVIIWELATLKRPWEGVKPMEVSLLHPYSQILGLVVLGFSRFDS
jgi:serine/threonine protein kinase